MSTTTAPNPGGKKEKKEKQSQAGVNKDKHKGCTDKQQSNKSQNKQQQQQDNNDDVRREQKLQAILLADSFSKTFRPITLETPKVLLPLVNAPMLEYTIEFLAQNGVEEVGNNYELVNNLKS